MVLHVGLQKTGSTVLQEQVFKRLPVNYVRYLDKALYRLRLDDGRLLVVSNEDFCGIPHMVYDEDMKRSRYRMARSLAALFPGAGVVVGVRDPERWLRSLYVESVRQGLCVCFKRFRELFDRDMLDFDKYIGLLERLFPRVFVYRFERLQQDFFGVVRDLCGFMGVDVPSGVVNKRLNTSLRWWQLPGFQMVNMVCRKPGYHPKGVVPRTWFEYVYNRIRMDGGVQW